jgi:hypothetical protein
VRILAALVASSVIALGNAHAAHVIKVKGQKVLIERDNGDDELLEGDVQFIVIANKKRGVVTIQTVRGTRAIAELIKGRAEVGAKLRKATATGTETNHDSSRAGIDSNGGSAHDTKKSGSSFSPKTIGFSLGMNQVSQSIKATVASTGATETVSTTGSSFGARALAEWPLTQSMSLVVRPGLEQFSTSGSSSVGSVSTSILYLIGDALIRYDFSNGDVVPWAAAGMSVEYPLSKSSNVLNTSQISATTIIDFVGGLDYKLKGSSKLEASLEYGYYPVSGAVTTSSLALRVGYLWPY